jgi:hypothetical protein
MERPPRTLAVLAVVALVATAGCLTGPLGAGTGTTAASDEPADTTNVDTERTTGEVRSRTGSESSAGETTERNDLRVWDADASEAPDLAASLADPVQCDDGWVSYWGTGNAGMLWNDDGVVRTGWTVPGNQSTLFVGFENTTAVGYDHVEYDQSVTADGDGVDVGNGDGTGRYAVVMMLDVNENGEYDPETDRPCASENDDAGISWTGWLWVDWDVDD